MLNVFNADRAFNPGKPSIQDALPWHVYLGDGRVLTKRGGVMSGWAFHGRDMIGLPEDAVIDSRQSVEGALRDLADRGGFTLQQTVSRSPSTGYPRSTFPSASPQLIDDERYQFWQTEGAHYESRYFKTLTHLPTLRDFWERPFLPSDVAGDEATPAAVRFHLFEEAVTDYTASMGRAVTLERLGIRESADPLGGTYLTDDLLNFLWFIYSGELMAHRLPERSGFAIEDLLGGRPFVPGINMMVGDEHVRVIDVKGFPKDTNPFVLAAMNSLPVTYRATQRARLLTEAEARTFFSGAKSAHAMASVSVLDAFRGKGKDPTVEQKRHQRHLEADAEDAITEIDGGGRFVRWTSNVVIRGSNLEAVHEACKSVVAILKGCGFSGEIAKSKATRIFLGSMHGETEANWRRRPVHLRQYADIFPFSDVWPGLETIPSPKYPPNSPPILLGATTGSTPFRLVLHSGGSIDAATNSHTVVLGPSGAGKTVLLNAIAAQFLRYDGAQLFYFDKDYGAYPLAKALEAEGIASYHEVDAEMRGAINPFHDIVDGPRRRARRAAYLYGIALLRGVTITPEIRDDVITALDLLADNVTRSQDFEPMFPDIYGLRAYLGPTQMREVIDDFLKGEAGPLFGATNDFSDRRVHFFECSRLLKMSPEDSIPVFQHYFDVIDERATGAPTLIVIDETKPFLAHDLCAQQFEAMYRGFRDRNVTVVAATQNPEDFLASRFGRVLLSQAASVILLPDPKMNREGTPERKGLRELYIEAAGVTDEEVMLLSRTDDKGLKQQKDYYLINGLGRRPFSLRLGRIAKALLCSGGTSTLATFRARVEQYGSGWVEAYLREIGLGEWADYYRRVRGRNTSVVDALTNTEEVAA